MKLASSIAMRTGGISSSHHGRGSNSSNSRNHSVGFWFVLLSCFLACCCSVVQGSTPNVLLTVDGLDEEEDDVWDAKRGLFGSDISSVSGELLHAPDSDKLLCEFFNQYRRGTNGTIGDPYVADQSRNGTALGKDIILLTPRGNCTFERKAWVAQTQYGAVGILIYDNLPARYRWNETSQEVGFPQASEDYECSKGFGLVKDLDLDPPAYDETILNPFLDRTLPTSTCNLNVTNTDNSCESNYCLVTSHKPDTNEFPVCCAWDNHITMNVDKAFKKRGEIDDIMAVMITIRQSEQFLQFLGKTITMTQRPYNAWNVSMFMLWILGTAITGYACWYSAQNYRYYRAKLKKIQGKKKQGEENDDDPNGLGGDYDDDDDVDDVGNRRERDLPMEIDINDEEEDEEEEEEEDEFDEEYQMEEEEEVAVEEEEEVEDIEVEPEEVKKKQKKKKKKKKSNGTTLHSLPPSRSRSDKDEEPEIYTIYFRKKKHSDDDDSDDDDDDDDEEGDNNKKTFTLYSLPPPERKRPKKQRPNPDDIENDLEDKEDDEENDDEEPDVAASGIGTMEMSIQHVAMFVVVASCMLLLLFFLNLYNIVTVIYAIGCAGSVSFLIFGPLIGKIAPKLGDEVVEELNKKVICNLNGFDVMSQGAGYIWAGIWLWYGLSHYRPSQNWFFWISLNVFGACFCILMQSMFKLNSLKIAAMLGVAVFFYDIFFVFITPFLTGGDSIMLTVARGGAEGAASADDLCYKYPKHKDCTGIDFLPMLLAFPRINDYRGGASLLGLGDIVLPGFLISFAARVDEAKRLLAYHTSIEVHNVPHKWYQGYLFPLMVAYGFGLLLANVAVVLMQQGQPALLYLVPCCLGTMAAVGRSEFKEMWEGSKVLRMADKLIRKCEKHWGKQRMKKLVEKRKREQAAAFGRDRGGSRPSINSARNGAPQERGRGPTREGSQRNGRGVPPGGRQPGRGRGGGPGRGRGGPRAPGGGSGRRPRPPGETGGRSGRGSNPGRRPPAAAGQTGAPNPPRKTGRGGPPENAKRPQPSKDPQSGAAPKGTPGKGPKKPTDRNSPTDEDVCFGKKDHLGNLEFYHVVNSTAKAMGGKEFDMPIYKSIRKQLKGRRLFKKAAPGTWVMANKDEAIDLIRDAFNEEKKKLGSA